MTIACDQARGESSAITAPGDAGSPTSGAGASPDVVAKSSGPYGLDRLGFDLPEFTRISWTSDKARAVWEPRLRAITKAWLEIEWRSVLAGVRPCSITVLAADALPDKAAALARAGLASLPLEVQGLSPYVYSNVSRKPVLGQGFGYRMVLGRQPDIGRFLDAWDAADDVAIGDLLGYPPCCRAFFREIWVDHGMRDTTWPMAWRSVSGADGRRTLEVGGPAAGNILCRWFGVRPVFHLPCRSECSASVALGERLMALGRDMGHAEAIDWMLEVLGWPIEWSALHGIAEIKTPVLKVTSTTDATATKYVVHRRGTTFPEEGARGLGFAFHLPHPPLLTGSKAYRQGLRNPLPTLKK